MNEQIEVIALLKSLIAIDSRNPFKDINVDGKTAGIGNEEKIAIYLEKVLHEAGFRVAQLSPTSGRRDKFHLRWALL